MGTALRKKTDPPEKGDLLNTLGHDHFIFLLVNDQQLAGYKHVTELQDSWVLRWITWLLKSVLQVKTILGCACLG